MQTIGKALVAVGGLVIVFLPNDAQIGEALVTVGNGLIAGKGTVGPVRAGNEGITVTVGPWKGP